jgi:hypothetical protein
MAIDARRRAARETRAMARMPCRRPRFHLNEPPIMNSWIRLLAALLQILGASAAESVHAAATQIVFDNTPGMSRPSFGPSCCQVGNEISLAANARKIVELSWGIESQGNDLLADIEAQIYANDGPGGAPGALIWSSGLLDDVAVSAGDDLLDISVPRVRVPDFITVTMRIVDSAPVALGRLDGGPPSVGSIEASWIETAPGVWRQEFGPWALRVTAVPEPATLLLVAVAALALRRPGPRRRLDAARDRSMDSLAVTSLFPAKKFSA